MNGHVGSSNFGYDGMHGGLGYGDKNTDRSRILEFTGRLTLVICNTVHEAGIQVGDMISYCMAGG